MKPAYLEYSPKTSLEREKVGYLKFEILASGIQVTDSANRFIIARDSKMPLHQRSGAAAGLDLVLPHHIHVNAPVVENFALLSSLILDNQDNILVLRRGEEVLCEVIAVPKPTYHSGFLSDGTPIVKVGQACNADRFCVSMTGPHCFFWAEERRCQYCAIGRNDNVDEFRKSAKQIADAFEIAMRDSVLPSRHIMIGGGTPNGSDRGAVLAAEIAKEIRRRGNESKIYVMIVAPEKNEHIDILKDAGVDEVAFNVELFSPKARKEIIPGKENIVGLKRYLKALEYSVKVFGSINTRSVFVVGLEDGQYSIEGGTLLASMGVMPILSAFRSLNDTMLGNKKGFSAQEYFEIYSSIKDNADRYNIPVGPTCIACQNNVLALPYDSEFHRYY